METSTRWCGIAVLGLVVGCGSPGPSPQDSTPGGTPESGGTAAAGSPSESPPEAKSVQPAAAESTPPTPIAPVPDDESPAPPATAVKQPGPMEAAENSAPTMDQLRAWATALAGDAVQAREAAAAGLDRAAQAGTPPLWALLQDASPAVRRGAIFYWLDRFDPADADAVAALSKCLSDPDPTVRAIAVSAAQRFPAEALAKSSPQLSAMLADRQTGAETRAAAARLIGTLDAPGDATAEALAQAAVGDPAATVRSAALMSLGRVAPADQAAAVLQQVLVRDVQANVRGMAAARLGKLGPAAAGAAPALADALADSDEGVRRKAADALAALGAAAVTPASGQLEAADPGVRRLAVFVLGKLGADAKPALDALRKRLQDSDAEVKQLAELAIRRIEGTERNP
jgi:HEAT repeat protein